MKKQFAGLLCDIGFVGTSDPKQPMANVNSGTVVKYIQVYCLQPYLSLFFD